VPHDCIGPFSRVVGHNYGRDRIRGSSRGGQITPQHHHIELRRVPAPDNGECLDPLDRAAMVLYCGERFMEGAKESGNLSRNTH
jgi:hypothetical protein